MSMYSNVLNIAFMKSIKTFDCATELRGLWALAAQPELLLFQTSILCGPPEAAIRSSSKRITRGAPHIVC